MEFALVLPILLLVIIGMIEAGRLVFSYSTLTSATREGARLGSVVPTNFTAIRNQVVSSAYGLGLTALDVTISCQPSNDCSSGNQIVVAATYRFRPIVGGILPSVPLTTSASMTIE